MGWLGTNGQRMAQRNDWMKLQRAQLEDLYRVNSDKNNVRGTASEYADADARSKFANTSQGRYWQSKGSKAFEDAYANNRYGGFTHLHGNPLSDEQVEQYLRMNNIAPPGLGTGQRQVTTHTRNTYGPSATAPLTAPATMGSGAGTGNSLLDQYMNSIKMQANMANAANEARYRQVLNSKNNLMNNVSQRLEGWGDTQHALNEELMKERLADIQADLSSRGLGNTTRGAAFQERNARDLGFLQQALAEKVDERAINYMTDLTQDRDAFVERRTDEAPDVNEALKLALVLGERGNGAGMAAGGVPGGAGMVPASTTTVENFGPTGNPNPWGATQPQYTPLLGATGGPGTGLYPAADAINQAILGSPGVFGGGQRPNPKQPTQVVAGKKQKQKEPEDRNAKEPKRQTPQDYLYSLYSLDPAKMTRSQRRKWEKEIRRVRDIVNEQQRIAKEIAESQKQNA